MPLTITSPRYDARRVSGRTASSDPLPIAGKSAGVTPQGHRQPAVEAELDRRDPAAVPRATWRQEIMGAGALMLLVGGWLIVSPYVLAYEPADAAWSPTLAGIMIVLFTSARVTFAIWQSWFSWLNAALGAGLVLSALWLAESATARGNEAVGGAIVVVLALLSGGASDQARRRLRSRE